MFVLQTAKSFVMLRVLNDIKKELSEQRQAARERLEDSNNNDKASLSQVSVYSYSSLPDLSPSLITNSLSLQLSNKEDSSFKFNANTTRKTQDGEIITHSLLYFTNGLLIPPPEYSRNAEANEDVVRIINWDYTVFWVTFLWLVH